MTRAHVIGRMAVVVLVIVVMGRVDKYKYFFSKGVLDGLFPEIDLKRKSLA